MILNNVRMSKFSVVGETCNFTDHSLMEVETTVKVNLDSDIMIDYAELHSYEEMTEKIVDKLKNMVKMICENTSVANYAKFTLNDDEGFPLFAYVAFPYYNEIQYAVMGEDKEFEWSKRIEVTSDEKEIIEESARQIANGIFYFVEDQFFELEES